MFSCSPSDCSGCRPRSEEGTDTVKIDPWLLTHISSTHTPQGCDILASPVERPSRERESEETQEEVFFDEFDESSQISQMSSMSSCGQENRPQGNPCLEFLPQKPDNVIPKSDGKDENNVPWSL